MPPLQNRFGGNLPHYQQQQPQYPGQQHVFMNTNTLANPFSTNGNALGMAGGFVTTGGLNMPGGTGLASHAAQMSFAGAMPNQGRNGPNEARAKGDRTKGRIRDVWKHNLEEEMVLLRRLADKYQYIAMDTEFPGLIARPMGSFRGKNDYHYQTLRCNVDLLKIIQLGITLFSEDGKEIPSTETSASLGDVQNGLRRNGNAVPLPCTWQFNFQFSTKDDMYSEVSVKALQDAGLNFDAIEKDGIDPFVFASKLTDSGLVGLEEVRWVSFHGGYDFGYLTKLLTNEPLPDDERQFDILMKKWFPSIYDIKYLMKWAIRQHSMGGTVTPLDNATTEILSKFEQKASLEGISESLRLGRLGSAHTAGSDSLLTGNVFFKMRELIFNDHIPEEHIGKVWGLGYPENNVPNPQSTPQHHQQQPQQQLENTPPHQNGNPYSNGTPSTPNTGHVGLASTPAHLTNVSGPLTPGGGGGGGVPFGGGAFGGFMTNNR